MATKNATAETKSKGFQPGTGAVVSYYVEDPRTGVEIDVGYKYLTIAELKLLVASGGKAAIKSRIRLSEEGLAVIDQ